MSAAEGPVKVERKDGQKAVKIAYVPVALLGKVAAGALTGMLVGRAWAALGPGRDDKGLPKARNRDYRAREVLLAACLQGAIGAVVAAAVDRAGARQFERWTGVYPAA